ncbi:Hpt domain-containing protein [Paucibacter sp. R3-3]|uniref:Hpt domain-containing protein n=1 Tax=Roseateles agri TaxID=3098619 RepID=A0ABU5DPD7_9BURK|nr:Hpt domain-containing protein [Paucibacter sp. R3-3]MDY0747586.1 Hpt domain-containing protein [Paucibacter sp. R3-3]
MREKYRYNFFLMEARDLLSRMGRLLPALMPQTAASQAYAVDSLVDIAHTLKGAAAVVGLEEIAKDAIAIEAMLKGLRESSGRLSADQIETMRALHERIAIAVSALDTSAAAS